MNQLFNQILQSQLKQNPNYDKVQQMIQEAGGDPRKAAMEEAKRQGVDINGVLERAKSMMLNMK